MNNVPTSQAADPRRNPPAPLAPRELNLPEPVEARLSNGLRVVVVEDRRLPLVNFRLALTHGSAFDPVELPGLLDLLTNQLAEGTSGGRARTSREIADEVARIGATLSADANSDYTVIAASALTAFADVVLGLMADVTLRPSFPESELALARRNTIEGLVLQRSQPSFLASERAARALYGEHPYGVIAPTPDAVERITREDLTRHRESLFNPATAYLIAVGDLRADDFFKQAEGLFCARSWTEREAPAARFPAPPALDGNTIHLVDRTGSQQTNIVIGNRGITRTDPDYFPLLLMNTVLGANASSRVFMNLREEKGYTYGAYTSLDARRDAGTFRASSEVRTDVIGAALKEFFYEFNRIRDERVPDHELADAKSYLTGVFPIRLETQEGLISQLVQIKMYDLPDDYLRTYRAQVAAVTAEDVQRVARLHVTPDRAAIIIVGDRETVLPQVEPYAQDIQTYDTAGRRTDVD